MLFEDLGLNRLIYSKLQLPTASVSLHNGSNIIYKGSFIKQLNHGHGKKKFNFYQSTFDLMQQCAKQSRLSQSSFQYSLITNGTVDSYLLPYCRFISISENDGKYTFRVFHQHVELSDILHSDSETFNYIFHQAKADFYRFLKYCVNIENRITWVYSTYGLLFAGLLKRLNLSCNVLNFEKLLRLLDVPNSPFVRANSVPIIENANYFAQKFSTADEIHYTFVKTIDDQTFCRPLHTFQVSVSVNNKKLSVEVCHQAILSISEHEICITSSEKGQVVVAADYDQMTRLKLCKSKQKWFQLHLADSSVIDITILSDSSKDLESCIALIDMYFRGKVKSIMLIEPVSNNHFDSYAMTYNELNQSQTSTNIYNVIEKSGLPLKFVSVKQSRQILRDLGFQVGWYVLFKPPYLPHIYLLCIVLNSETNGDKKTHPIKVVNKDGYFMVDETSKKKKSTLGPTELPCKYRSLEALLNSIKIRVRNKDLVIRPTQIVTEEMITDIRKTKMFFSDADHDFHKQSNILSLFCLNLIPNSSCTKSLCTSFTGHWVSPQGQKKAIRAFLYNKKYMEKDSLTIVARIAEISRPEFVHENILKCFGYADDGLNTIYYVHEQFGLEFSDTFVQDYTVDQLYDFGRQIKNGLQFLHDRDIVHGFPALQNVYINESRKQVKLGKIGILSAIMHASETHRSDEGSSSHGSSFLKAAKCPEVNELLSSWFSQKRVRMLHEYPEEKLQETWDRYVFGCTLWQLYNKGAVPLPDKSDQDILEKLEGKDFSWFTGGGYFRLPNTDTEFLNKLQKIICVCVTWGNKDNLEKYEFRKIAAAYEELADVVNIEEPTSSDFILKAGNGKLDFDVNVTEPSNCKYTLVEEDDNKRVVLLSSKKSNLPRIPSNMGGQLNQVKDMLLEKDKLLQLSDLQRPDEGNFMVPPPGTPKIEALCSRFSLNKNVWVKSYSKCKDVPEQDFIEEVKHLLKFEHPNIVPLKGCVLLEDILLLITPCYRYKSLSNFLDNNSHNITEKQRESYAVQICAGMKYLSLNKCVHRNLRLEHVYMTNYNDVVITNFGLARVTEALYYQQRRIMASDTFVIYPPEVIAVLSGGGKVKFNSACDVWSYGVLLWELYSGNIAYHNVVSDLHGNSDINLLDQYFREGNCLEPDPSWPANILAVIEKCLTDEQRRINFFGIEDVLTGS
ncbi:uncharacterized protein LOC134811847 isoform X2 [Bolinopsis microptera]|uniref:uncharacterized protein LOC134811847 isoform X2 n=1 Tax=Bolinopsis microptera TaxID=2820187 RepID=UPI00307AF724